MELSPLKEAMLLMTMTCRVFMGKKTLDGNNYLTNIVIEAFTNCKQGNVARKEG